MANFVIYVIRMNLLCEDFVQFVNFHIYAWHFFLLHFPCVPVCRLPFAIKFVVPIRLGYICFVCLRGIVDSTRMRTMTHN